MEFNKIHNVSKLQLIVLLLARFVMIIICFQLIFQPCRTIIKKQLSKDLRVHLKIKSDFMKEKLCNSIADEPRGILC
ncbi:hypothetical protein ES705_49489 [subsurface metagenome]